MAKWAACRAAALAVLLCCAAQAAPRRVRVGVYRNPPKVGISASGSPEGVFIDIIEAVAEREKWSLQYVEGTWTEGLDRLARGEIDLMPDVAYSQAREEFYSFHRETVLSDWFQIYARRGSGIASLVDLSDKRVAVLDRSVQHEALKNASAGFDVAMELVPFADYQGAFGAVAAGKVDAVVANRFYGAQHSDSRRVVDTAIIFNPTRLYFAGPKGRVPDLLVAIDRQLARMKDDPDSTYYRSLRRWTSDPVAPRLPLWLKSVVPAAVGALFVFLAWSLLLKRQVAARTRELDARNEENSRLCTQVQRHAEELEGRVDERTRELAEANRNLRQAKEAAESADHLKSAFLATMSHELRTPLNSIIGFTGILLQRLAGPLNEEQDRQLQMVQASSRHLLALINDVLDISKIEAGQLNVECVPLDLREIVAHVVDTVMPTAEKHGLRMRVELGAEPGNVWGDRRRVEQILMNLLSNAVKFTESGEIVVGCGIADGAAVATVRDTGIGIAAEDLPRLFRPFEQIDSGLSRKHEGTGLGLSISHRLAELMGGSIGVDSELGKGSVFAFRLPLAQPEEDQA